MDGGTRADELEEARNDVDLNLAVGNSAECVERRLVGELGKGEHDAVDVELAHDLRQLVDRSEHVLVSVCQHACARAVPVCRSSVDEADHVDPVLGMLEELARDQLTDPAGADDHRVVDVRQTTVTERARHDAAERERHKRDGPEDAELAWVGMRPAADD